MTPEFIKYPKMARLSREIVITEKIDGTNAQILIQPIHRDVLADISWSPTNSATVMAVKDIPDSGSPTGVNPEYRLAMYAGSRSRFLTRQTDNFGFAKWVQEHAEELWALGEGRHFGEWWGSGIQRGYGLPKGEKRFSLFNVQRWFDQHTLNPGLKCTDVMEMAPACCHVVPVLLLLRGIMGDNSPEIILNWLRENGSYASPGFMKPEGIVVWHTAGNVGFKKTIEGDEKPKSLA